LGIVWQFPKTKQELAINSMVVWSEICSHYSSIGFHPV